MHKKILRIAALLLVVLTFVSMLPATETVAASSEAERISALAESTYRQALKRAKRSSFHGWCGAAVDWQMQLLGITTKMVGSNGNDKFDQYRYKDYTSGGYRITALAKKQYNLEAALNALTDNGTKNAYNIMVGFQSTNTSAGRKYGHATFIYAILDGIVYFTESYTMHIGGKRYAEGKCIAVTIEQFAKYYNSWCKYEGLIHFGLKTYAEGCERLNSYLYAGVTTDTVLYSSPCTPEVDDRSAPVRQLQAGERLEVTALYRNTEGEYWYEVVDTDVAYVRADDTKVLSMRYDDVSMESIKAPSVLTEGSSFNIKGSVTGKYVSIVSIRAQVYLTGENGMTHMMTTNANVNDNEYTLYKSTVAKRLKFKLLDKGSYHYEVAAVVSNHYYADGELQTEWQTIKLWSSDFLVVAKKGETASVTYDANGGTAEHNAAELLLGQPLEHLPEAYREGYVFDGWYTEREGGEKVDEDYVLESKMTLYAHWIEADHVTGWYTEDGRTYYVEDGVRPVGFFQVDGVTYHQGEDGYLSAGWTDYNGERFYFNVNGTVAAGWLVQADGIYYIGVDGTMVIGWALIDDKSYYFGEDGRMLVGSYVIDGMQYEFDENGVLIQNILDTDNKDFASQ